MKYYHAADKGAVPQACGLRNGLFGQQGGFHLSQQRGSRDGDLKPGPVRASGLRQMPLCAFLCVEIEYYCAWKFVKS